MQSTTHYSDHLKVLVSDRNDGMQMQHFNEIIQIGAALHNFDTNFIAAEFSSNTKRVKKECSSNIVQQATYLTDLQSKYTERAVLVSWGLVPRQVYKRSSLILPLLNFRPNGLYLRASGTV